MHHSKKLFLALFVLSCGGSVIIPDEEGAGGTGGNAGFGGSGGSGGGIAGSGGSGGVAGSGGTPCQPLPDCNWCGGTTKLDINGCEVGYVCANGVDPCTTDPCFGPNDCGPNQVCIDNLCWNDNQISCDEGMCSGGVGGGSQFCDCEWSCNDGNTYAFRCSVTGGSSSCECFINGISNTACGAGGGGGPVEPCSTGKCCGFPQ